MENCNPFLYFCIPWVPSALRELNFKGDNDFSDKSSTFDSYFVMPVDPTLDTKDREVCLCYEMTFGSSQSKGGFSLVLFQKYSRNFKEKNQVTDTSYICFLVVWVSYSLEKGCKLMAVKSEIFFFVWGRTERPPAAWTALTDTFRSIHCEIASVTGSSSVQVDQSCHLCFQVVMNRPVVPQVPLESMSIAWEKNVMSNKIILCFPSSNFWLLFT